MRPPLEPPRPHDLRVVRDPVDPDGRRTAEHLVQLHIQKTSGTSLGQFLRRFYRVEEQLIDSPTGRRTVDLWPDAIAKGRRFFQGHVQLHDVRSLLPDAHVVTMLREPIARVVSQYHHYRRTSDAGVVLPDPEQRRAVLAARYDIDEWLDAQERGEPCYSTDRMVAALGADEHSEGGRGSLERALAALRTDLIAFGTAERQHEALRLLCDALLLDPAWAGFGERLNVGPSGRPSVSARTTSQIAEQNPLDVELFAAAEDLLAERVAALDRRSPTRPTPTAPPPATGLVLSLESGGLRGPGLHEPEHLDEPGTSHVWTGAAASSQIPFEADLPARLLRIELTAFGSSTPEAWDDLRVGLDGAAVAEVDRWRDDAGAHLVAAAVAGSGPVHHVDLVGPVSSIDDDDPRLLGVSLHTIAIETWTDDALVHRDAAEQAEALTWATETIDEQRAALAQRDETIAWALSTIHELEATIAQRDEAIAWLQGLVPPEVHGSPAESGPADDQAPEG